MGEDSGSEPQPLDIDWQDYFSDRSDLGQVRQPLREYPDYSPEQFLSRPPTLSEHLLEQLLESGADAETLRITRFLIGCLNGNGYLQIDLTTAARLLAADPLRVEQGLQLLQGLEPAGVGARDLAECLLLQLRREERLTPAMETLIRHHLEDVAHGRLQRIATALRLSTAEVQGLVDRLRTLNPKPGAAFSSLEEVRYIVPEVVVERVAGKYVVLVNDTAVPRLGVNQRYQALLRNPELKDSDVRKFLESKLNAAAWLIRSVEQRRSTLYRIACSLVEQQQEFLDHGIKQLKPLTLRQVAEEVGVHESTVSRTIANKYIQTPQGVFELKTFFSSGVEDEQGTGYSASGIKRMLKDLVAGEDSHAPLSDQKLTELLQAQGVPVSRRTIAKYRSEAGIAPAAQRRRY